MRWYTPYFTALLLVTPSGAHSQQVAPLPAAATHQDLRGFWNRDDARAWDRPVSPNTSRGVVYHDYPQMIDQIKEDEKAAAARAAAEAKMPVVPGAANNLEKPQNSPENQQISNNPAQQQPSLPASTPLSREQILAKYGAPEEAQIIRAQKDAPPAMQGLFEALNSNDKELAFKYAVALARRQAEMQKVVSKATDYQMLAMEALGIRPAGPLPDDGEPIDPVRAEVQEYYEQARQAELKNGSSIDLHLDEDAQDPAATPDTAAAAAARARAAQHQQIIPADPEGSVKVLIFLDEKAPDAAKLAEGLKPVRTKYQGDPKFALFGLTKRTYSANVLKKRGAEISFPFPLVSGEALAIDLRIKSYPTTVFVAATTKETYRVEGVPSAEEIQRVVGVMRGGGLSIAGAQRSDGR